MSVHIFMSDLLHTNRTDSHSHPGWSSDLFPFTVSSAEIWTSDKKHKEDTSLSCVVLARLFVSYSQIT